MLIHPIWFYKKRSDISSAQEWLSCFLNFQKKGFPFFLKIAQNLSTVSYKDISYKKNNIECRLA